MNILRVSSRGNGFAAPNSGGSSAIPPSAPLPQDGECPDSIQMSKNGSYRDVNGYKVGLEIPYSVLSSSIFIRFTSKI